MIDFDQRSVAIIRSHTVAVDQSKELPVSPRSFIPLGCVGFRKKASLPRRKLADLTWVETFNPPKEKKFSRRDLGRELDKAKTQRGYMGVHLTELFVEKTLSYLQNNSTTCVIRIVAKGQHPLDHNHVTYYKVLLPDNQECIISNSFFKKNGILSLP